MPFEIEKKFLVTGEQFKQDAEKQVRIVQGYLSTLLEKFFE